LIKRVITSFVNIWTISGSPSARGWLDAKAREAQDGPVMRALDSAMPALLSSAATLACTPDLTPPVLEHAEFEDASTLLLSFSEPLAPVDEVDPSTHFRLASAFVLDELTVYYDLSYHFDAGGPARAAQLDSWPRHGNAVISRVERGDDETQLRLTLAYPLEHYVCDELDEAAILDIPAAIHLHYAQAAYPRVTDEAGNPLADNGAWWVALPGIATTRPGAFDLIESRLPIACP
jgi:hypothetical protein